jgi:hypothetical protein
MQEDAIPHHFPLQRGNTTMTTMKLKIFKKAVYDKDMRNAIKSDFKQLQRVASAKDLEAYLKAVNSGWLDVAFAIVSEYDPDNTWNVHESQTVRAIRLT